MSDYNSYLEYIKHVEDETIKTFQQQLDSAIAAKEEEYKRLCEQYQQTLIEKDDSINKLKKEIAHVRHDLSEQYASQIKEIEAKNKIEKSKDQKCFKEAHSALEKKLSNLVEQYDSQIKAKDDSEATLRADVKQLKESQQPLIDKIQALETERNKLTKELDECKSKLHSIEEFHTQEFSAYKTKHQHELDELRSKHQCELATVKNKYQQEIKQLRADNEKTLQDWNIQFATYKSEVSDGVRALQKEIEHLNQQLKEKDELLKAHSQGGVFGIFTKKSR